MQQLSHAAVADRRLRPHNHHHHLSLKCPRCDSPNTKFCYYNNYNLSQPRHYCKSCRRYWTKGGVLRNVPVGGGCRKSKRSSKSKNDAVATTTTDRKSVQNEKSSSSESSSNKTTASESNLNPYGFSDPSLFNFNQAAATETDGQIFAEFGGGDVANATASFQVSGNDDGGFGAVLDWGTGGGDQGGLFDLTAAIDPSYWSQTQWTDNDQSLNYLP